MTCWRYPTTVPSNYKQQNREADMLEGLVSYGLFAIGGALVAFGLYAGVHTALGLFEAEGFMHFTEIERTLVSLFVGYGAMRGMGVWHGPDFKR